MRMGVVPFYFGGESSATIARSLMRRMIAGGACPGGDPGLLTFLILSFPRRRESMVAGGRPATGYFLLWLIRFPGGSPGAGHFLLRGQKKVLDSTHKCNFETRRASCVGS